MSDDVLNPGSQLGDYRLGEQIARGGMATVYSAEHRHSGERCAIKVLHPLGGSEESRARFRREFMALSRLEHPHVLRVHEAGMHGDRPWYAMERLDGRELGAEVQSWRDLPAEDRFHRARAILAQVASALAFIHAHGLIHRDVTPSNIMVDRAGKATLMDFGVVKEMGGSTEVTQAGQLIGTVAYMAPEQVQGEALDARADLYSLGAVAYLMLTGRRPFSARNLRGVLHKHLNERPRPPRELRPLVPRELDELVMRLLEKRPADRYASANHVLHVLGATHRRPGESTWPPRTRVGRVLERARLLDAVDAAAAGRTGRTVLLRAEAGQGKSFLLGAVAEMTSARDLLLVRAGCQPQDRPFGPFVRLYEQLRREGERRPVLQTALLGDGGQGGERYPVLAAYRELLVERAPCVVAVDNLHHAEHATIELLEYLIRNTQELASAPVSFVLTEGADAASRITRQLPIERHRLQPLSAAEVEELVLSALPDEPATRALAARLHQESGGSPALVTDMLRGLRDDGLVARVDGVWRLTVDKSRLSAATLPLPASLRQVLNDRLCPLSEEALAVARVLATARRAMDADTLIEVVGLEEDLVMDALDELEDTAIVEERREEDRVLSGLSHERFRDVLLAGESPVQLRDRHRRIGEVIEQRWREHTSYVVEELAYHFEHAGVAPKAYAYLLQTARRHQRLTLFDESLAFLDRALAMEPEARPYTPLHEADRLLAQLHLGRSRALHGLGEWEEALQSAREAEAVAARLGDPRTCSQVAAALGDQLRQLGALEQSERQLRRALELAEQIGDDSQRAMPLYWLGAVRWLQGELEEPERLWRQALGIAQQLHDERAIAWAHNGLGIMAVCHGRPLEARRMLERSADSFDRLGMLNPLAIARVNLVELYLSLGLLRKALELSEKTIGTAREVQHVHGISLGLVYRSQTLLALGREEEAHQNATEALRLIRRLGNREDQLLALVTLARVALERGQPEAALSHLRELGPLLEEHEGEGIVMRSAARRAEALALLHRREEARALLAELPSEIDSFQHVQVRNHLALGRAHRSIGDPKPAIRHLQRALSLARDNSYRYYQLMAHHLLSELVEESAQGAHRRAADSLARSLAANLPRDQQTRFLDRWRPGRHLAADQPGRSTTTR